MQENGKKENRNGTGIIKVVIEKGRESEVKQKHVLL